VSLDPILFLDFLKTFCEHAPWNKLCGNTNFIICGPKDQKLWMFETFRRSLGRFGHVLEPTNNN
jgi:hypothetical protein